MSKSKSKPASPSPEIYFQKSFFLSSFSNTAEFQNKLNSFLMYMVDLEELHSLESRKPFFFLLETFLNKPEFFSIKDPEISIIFANVLAQLMRLLNLDLKQNNEKILNLFGYLANTLDLASKNLDKVEMTQIYYYFETLETTQAFSIPSKDFGSFGEPLEDFLRIFFECEEIFIQEPEILKKTLNILSEYFINIEELQEKLFFLINRAILDKKNNPRTFDLVKSLLLVGNLRFRLNFARYEIALFQGKRILKLKDFSIAKLLQILQKIFKIDGELLLDLVKYLEFAIFDQKSEISESQKNLYIAFIGQISQPKNSKVFELFPKIFKEFIIAINKKSFQKIRYEIAKNLRKFLRNHQNEENFIKKSQETRDFLEEILIEFLFNGNEKDWSVKLYLFRSFEEDCLKFPNVFSEKFFKNVFAKTISQGFFIKERVFTWFFAIYDHFCVNLYRKGVFSWRNLDFSQENDDFFESEKTSALKFEFLLQEFLNLAFKLQKNESGLLIFLFDSLYFSRNFSIKGLIGIHYAILEKTLKEGFLIDNNEKIYQKFLYKTLGMNWRVFYEKMMMFESVLMETSWDRVLKLKEKLPGLARKRFLEENTKENVNFLDFKLKKYFKDIGKTVESLDKLLMEDKNALEFIKILRKDENTDIDLSTEIKEKDNNILDLSKDSVFEKSHLNEEKEDKNSHSSQKHHNKKEEAFDYFLRKIKQENVHFLMKTWFSPEFLWDSEKEQQLLIEIQSRISFPELKTSDFLVILAVLDVLITLRKRLKIIYSDRLIYEIYHIFEQIHKRPNFCFISIDSPEKAQIFLDILKSKLLKILSISRLNKSIPKDLDVENIKDFFLEILQENCLKSNHAKNLSILIINLDEQTPRKNFKHLFRDSYQEILNFKDENSLSLSRNLKILRVYCKHSLYQEKLGFFLKNTDFFSKMQKSLLDEEKLENKGFIISEITLLKLDICHIFNHFLYFSDPESDILDLYKSNEKAWKSLLIKLITRKAPKNAEIEGGFIRVLAMKFFFMASLAKNKEISKEPANFIRLSLVCFEENIEIRKILFNFLIKFSAYQGKNPDFPLISLIFLFLLDPDKNLGFLCRNLLEKLIINVRNRVRKNMKKLLNKEKIAENSVEYSLVYLIAIFLNNPFFIDKDKRINFTIIFRFLNEFMKLFEENKEKIESNEISTNFAFEVIIRSLENHYQPKEFIDISNNKLSFYNLRGIKRNEDSDKKGDFKENYKIFLEILNDFIGKKLKGFGMEKNKEEVEIDNDFFMKNQEKLEKKPGLQSFKKDIEAFMEKIESKKSSKLKNSANFVKKKPEKSKKKREKKDGNANKKQTKLS